MVRYLKNMLQLAVSPVQGWRDVARENAAPRTLVLRGLVPWLAVVAASAVVGALYRPSFPLGQGVSDAVVQFVQYLAAYLLAPMAMSFFVDADVDGGVADSRRVDTLAAYCLGLLAAVTAVDNLSPVSLTLFRFLPLYVGVIAWFGQAYLGVAPARRWHYLALVVAAVLLPPYLIGAVFSLIL